MEFQNFHGTSDKGKRSDHDAEPRASTASQDAKRSAHGRPDPNTLVMAIASTEEEMAASNARAAQIQIRLEKLNQTVRGHHLPPADYRNLCDEQRALREEKNAANTIASDLRVRLAQLRREYEQVKDLRPDKLLLTNRLLKAILVELRELNGKGNGGGK